MYYDAWLFNNCTTRVMVGGEHNVDGEQSNESGEIMAFFSIIISIMVHGLSTTA